MKKQCFAVFFTAFLACAAAQNTSVTSPEYAPVTGKYDSDQVQEDPFAKGTPPSFPGGLDALLKFLGENIQYPETARSANIEGVVTLSFIVEKDGSIGDTILLKDIGGGCGQEAIRVVRAMPKWIPGMVDGKPVKVRYTLPVRFRLEDTERKKKKKSRQRDSLFGN